MLDVNRTNTQAAPEREVITPWTRSPGDLRAEISDLKARIADLESALAHQLDLNGALTRRCAMADDATRRAFRLLAAS
jgi:hypothetical protein